MAKGLKIKLHPDRFRALLGACQFVMQNYRMENDLDYLLMLRHKQMRDKVFKKSLELQQEYSISFDEAETMEFWLLWRQINLGVFEAYEANVMQEILNQIDKEVLTIKKRITAHEPDEHTAIENTGTPGTDVALVIE